MPATRRIPALIQITGWAEPADGLPARGLVAATYLAANTGGMPRKPQQPSQQTKWHVYLQARAARREWVGEIEAVDERPAIEIAAKEFKQPAKKLIATQRR